MQSPTFRFRQLAFVTLIVSLIYIVSLAWMQPERTRLFDSFASSSSPPSTSVPLRNDKEYVVGPIVEGGHDTAGAGARSRSSLSVSLSGARGSGRSGADLHPSTPEIGDADGSRGEDDGLGRPQGWRTGDWLDKIVQSIQTRTRATSAVPSADADGADAKKGTKSTDASSGDLGESFQASFRALRSVLLRHLQPYISYLDNPDSRGSRARLEESRRSLVADVISIALSRPIANTFCRSTFIWPDSAPSAHPQSGKGHATGTGNPKTKRTNWGGAHSRYAHLNGKAKVFIALNLHENERVLSDMLYQLVRLCAFLGYENVYLSVYENGSTDLTKPFVDLLELVAAALGIEHTVISTRETKDGSAHRIEYLARIRNEAMKPFFDKKGLEAGRRSEVGYDRILFLNDVFFCLEDVLEVLHQSMRQGADIACPLDYDKVKEEPGFYDTWVARDRDGRPFDKYPWDLVVREREARERMKRWLPFQAMCCWNGFAVLNPAPFRDHNATTTGGSQKPLVLDQGSMTDGLPAGHSNDGLSVTSGASSGDTSPRSHDRPQSGGSTSVRSTSSSVPPSSASASSSSSTSSSSSGTSPSSTDPPALSSFPLPPVRFRRSQGRECSASECSLLCKDFAQRGYGKVLVVPGVRVAYDVEVYGMLAGHNAIRPRKRRKGRPSTGKDKGRVALEDDGEEEGDDDDDERVVWRKLSDTWWCHGMNGAGRRSPDTAPVWEEWPKDAAGRRGPDGHSVAR